MRIIDFYSDIMIIGKNNPNDYKEIIQKLLHNSNINIKVITNSQLKDALKTILAFVIGDSLEDSFILKLSPEDVKEVADDLTSLSDKIIFMDRYKYMYSTIGININFLNYKIDINVNSYKEIFNIIGNYMSKTVLSPNLFEIHSPVNKFEYIRGELINDNKKSLIYVPSLQKYIKHIESDNTYILVNNIAKFIVKS